MRQKKELVTKVDKQEDFEAFLGDEQKKLIIVDLYSPWVGPCEMMKETYTYFSLNIENFINRCEVLQVNQAKVQYFESYRKFISKNFETTLYFVLSWQNRRRNLWLKSDCSNKASRSPYSCHRLIILDIILSKQKDFRKQYT